MKTGQDAFRAEVDRVHQHFVRVDALARARDVSTLDPERRVVRSLLLEELAMYRERRLFPLNREFRHKDVPCFIDEAGTRCAVAHLLEVSGQGEVAQSIARRRSYARVRELADDERVRAWLDATGITLEEATRIQPSYCFVTAALVCLCQATAPTIAEGVVVTSPDDGTPASIRIDRIVGEPTSFHVGDVVDVSLGRTSAGTRVLLSVKSYFAGSPPTITNIGLQVSDTTVTCIRDDFTRTHPIPKDVAYEAAVMNDIAACENRLGALDPTWNRSSCDDSTHLPGCACSLGRHEPPMSTAALTTAGVLAALLRHRARRSKARKRAA